MPINASDFYSNPIGNLIAAYTDVIGIGFYAAIMLLLIGYTLMNTESWPVTSVIAILVILVFSAVLPQVILILIGIAAVFVFAAVIIDVVILN